MGAVSSSSPTGSATACSSVVNRAIARQSKLPEQPFYEPADFPWVAPVEANWKAIRAELDAVLAYQDALPNFQDI